MPITTIQQQLLGLQDRLFSFALSMTENRDDAKDLLQETTLKVLDNEKKFAVDTNFKAWVFTMMRNIFINNYRRTVREQSYVSSREEVYRLEMPQRCRYNTPESELELVEMRKAMQELDEETRIPFTMHVMGYKYQEIADELDIPIGTVKSRIHVARKKLMKRLQA